MIQNELNMFFNYEPVLFGAVKTGNFRKASGRISNAVKTMAPGETVSDAMLRCYGKRTGFTHKVLWDDQIAPTLTGGRDEIWLPNGNRPSNEDLVRIQTFPLDYDFGRRSISYVCGMSVPPIMIKRIVNRLVEEGIFNVGK